MTVMGWQKEPSAQCGMCQNIVKFIQTGCWLSSIANEENDKTIMGWVAKSCNFLPEQFSKTCHTYVNEYGSQLKKMSCLFLETSDPIKVCEKIKSC